MSAFYNENDPKTAAWLRGMIASGLIAPGIVDERSIIEISPHELIGYTQCHFFAGIGGWSYAFRLAGISDDTRIWTGSCPCQPLSCAGQRKGHADERHLWPAFYRLIAECAPAIVLGEQVASPDGLEWFAGIRADLEGAGYAVGGADLCAAGVGAPHPRQRIYWMANAKSNDGRREQSAEGTRSGRAGFAGNSTDGGMAHAHGGKQRDGELQRGGEHGQRAQDGGDVPERRGDHGLGDAPGGGCGVERDAAQPGRGGHADGANEPDRMGDAQGDGLQRRENNEDGRGRECSPGRSGPWGEYDLCHFTGADAGKTRRIEPGTFPLAHGVSERMGLLRGYGNSICPQIAAEFIQAAVEAIG